MTILTKTLTDLQNQANFQVLFMQIVPPNLYVLMKSNVDGHLEAWSVSP